MAQWKFYASKKTYPEFLDDVALIKEEEKLSTISGAIMRSVKKLADQIRQKRKREERRDGKDL
jgi:hypothetical protein